MTGRGFTSLPRCIEWGSDALVVQRETKRPPPYDVSQRVTDLRAQREQVAASLSTTLQKLIVQCKYKKSCFKMLSEIFGFICFEAQYIV